MIVYLAEFVMVRAEALHKNFRQRETLLDP
jgi:hypothetical protein